MSDRLEIFASGRPILVECPFCGEDWREEFDEGRHDERDVRAHLDDEHDGSEISLDHPAVDVGVVLKRQLDGEHDGVER